MDNPGQRRKKPRKSESKFYTSTPFLALLAIGFIAFLFFVWHQKNLVNVTTENEQKPNKLTSDIAIPEPPTQKTTADQEVSGRNTGSAEEKTVSGQPLKNQTEKDTDLESSSHLLQPPDQQTLDEFLSAEPAEESQQRLQDILAEKQQKQQDVVKKDEIPLSLMCTASTRVVKEFYRYLDRQEYIQEFSIEPDSQSYFTALIQKLLDNPPIVSGETNDLFTILQNTAHFFRILGNENIKILKTILSNENERFETVLAQFYNVVNEPRCAKENFDLRIPDNALYEYAGFFLNTMGGRLYLFRRDSVSRMVISYYSILLIDKANKAAANTHGIEIATTIDLLIDEMEATSKNLKLRDDYLATLYVLQEEYQQ